jgi:rhodanese-related sulfurtransferase
MAAVPATATRDDVQRLLAEGAQIVEVLPREEYEGLHIAAALSIPLKELAARAPRELDPGRPVVTYCHDFL